MAAADLLPLVYDRLRKQAAAVETLGGGQVGAYTTVSTTVSMAGVDWVDGVTA